MQSLCETHYTFAYRFNSALCQFSVIIKKSLAFLLARGVPGLINLLTISAYTRLVSPEIYGQYSFSLAFITLAMTICFQWLQFGLLRFYHGKDIEQKVLLSTILFAFVLLSCTILPVFISIIQLIQADFTITILSYIFLLSLILSFFNIHLQIPVANGWSIAYGIQSSVKSALGLLLGILFIYLGYGLNGLFLALIIAHLLPVAWSFPKYWRHISWRFIDKRLLKSLFVYGLPLSGTLMMNMMINNSDRIMLSWLKGNEYTGLYSAVYDLTNFSLIIIMMAVNLAIYPLIIKAYENKDNDTTRLLIKQNLIALMLISLPLLLMFLILPHQLSDLLLGQQFREVGTDIMPIIGIATFIWGIKAFYFDLPFLLSHKTLSLLIIGVLGMVLNIILNYVLIPTYGIEGAAYATLITTSAVLIITSIWSQIISPLPLPVREVLKISAMGMVIAILLWAGNRFFYSNIVINSLATVFLFTLGVYLLNLLDFRQHVDQFLKLKK